MSGYAAVVVSSGCTTVRFQANYQSQGASHQKSVTVRNPGAYYIDGRPYDYQHGWLSSLPTDQLVILHNSSWWVERMTCMD